MWMECVWRAVMMLSVYKGCAVAERNQTMSSFSRNGIAKPHCFILKTWVEHQIKICYRAHLLVHGSSSKHISSPKTPTPAKQQTHYRPLSNLTKFGLVFVSKFWVDVTNLWRRKSTFFLGSRAHLCMGGWRNFPCLFVCFF